MLIVGLAQRNLSWLIYLEIQNLLPPSLMVWFLTWSTLSESLTQQRRIRLKNYLFWSLHHNPDRPSMIDFHPVLNCRLSWQTIRLQGCRLQGYSVCSKFSNYAFDNISSPFSNTFFSVTPLLEYSDKGLNHEFFSCRGFLPSNFHWFRSLPSQSADSLNFPKKNAFMIVLPRNSNSFSSVTRVCFLTSGSQPETLHL